MTKEDVRAYLASIGRKGGKKSGKARMEKMTAEQRSEIARAAAAARWKDAKPKKRAASRKAAPKEGERRVSHCIAEYFMALKGVGREDLERRMKEGGGMESGGVWTFADTSQGRFIPSGFIMTRDYKGRYIQGYEPK